MSSVTNYEVLCASPLGVDLGKGDCAALAEVLSTRQLKADEILIKENSTDDSLHVIISGRLAATCNTGNNDYVTLHTLRTGDMAGAMGFIDGTEHSATLRALSDTEVYTLKRQDLESLLDNHPVLVYKVMRSIIRSVHATMAHMNRQFVEMNNYIMKEHGRY